MYGDRARATVAAARPATTTGSSSTVRALPDPCSRWQPDGVRGPSRVVDTAAFAWTDEGWAGVSLADLVLYELHVGTFTGRGTFDAAIPHLPSCATRA